MFDQSMMRGHAESPMELLHGGDPEGGSRKIFEQAKMRASNNDS
jgi:hypothetical protein